jgi:hypothetical protein
MRVIRALLSRPTAEAASIERVRQRYFRPGAHERGLKILAIAQRIAALLREREANRKAIEVAASTFDLPPTPAELSVTYRGPFGPIQVDVDPEWLREIIPDLSPRSRRGRRLRKLLRLPRRTLCSYLGRSRSSGVGALVGEKNRIDGELEAAARDACSLEATASGTLPCRRHR